MSECRLLYSRLAEFYHLLRARGFNSGPDRWLDLQDLLLQLQQNNKEPQTLQELRAYLSPLFCSSPEDQSAFTELFTLWAQGQQDALAHTNILEPNTELPKLPEPHNKWFRRAAFLTILTLVFSGFALFFWDDIRANCPSCENCVFQYQCPHPVELPPSEDTIFPTEDETPDSYQPPSSDGTPDVVDVQIELKPIPPRQPLPAMELPRKSTLIIFLTMASAILGLPLLILFVGHWLAKANTRIAIKREKTFGENRLIHLNLRQGKSMPFALSGFTRKLRRSVLVTTRYLDIHKTIHATINKAGLFVPVRLQRNQAPEYLVLLDRSHSASQLSALGETLVQRLYHENINVHHYYYRKDPRWCYKKHGNEYIAINLETLLSQHAYARLIVIGNADALFSQLTHKIHSWVSLFKQWNHRIWLTNQPQPWGYHESQLAQAGFAVVPLCSDGLSAVADWLHNLHEGSLSEKGAPWFGGFHQHHFPQALTNAQDWLSQTASKTFLKSRLKPMLSQLDKYLGRDGMQLLCACAAYPEISGKLTIALEQKLFPEASPLAREHRLLRLSTLPWFEVGYLPDYLREELLYKLDHTMFKKIGKIYNELFVLDNPHSGELELALPNEPTLSSRIRQKLGLDKANISVPSQDQLLLKTLHGRRSRLDFILPPQISRQFFKSNHTRGRTGATIAALVVAAILLANGKSLYTDLYSTEQEKVFLNNANVSIQIEHNAASFALSQALSDALLIRGYKPKLVRQRNNLSIPNTQKTASTETEVTSSVNIISSSETARSASTIGELIRHLSYNALDAKITLRKDSSDSEATKPQAIVVSIFQDDSLQGAVFRDDFQDTLKAPQQPGWYAYGDNSALPSALLENCSPFAKSVSPTEINSTETTSALKLCDAINLRCKFTCNKAGEFTACNDDNIYENNTNSLLTWCEELDAINTDTPRELSARGLSRLFARHPFAMRDNTLTINLFHSPARIEQRHYEIGRKPYREIKVIDGDRLCDRKTRNCYKVFPRGNNRYFASSQNYNQSYEFSMVKDLADISLELSLGLVGPPVTGLSGVNSVKINQLAVAPPLQPGEAFTLSAHYSLKNIKSCPACITQLRVGFIGEEQVDCLYNGIPNPYEKEHTIGSANIRLRAPNRPGRYYLSYDKTMEYSCKRIRENAPEDKAHIIGFVDVIGKQPTTRERAK